MGQVYYRIPPYGGHALKGLAAEGKELKFQVNGTCTGEFPLDVLSTATLQEVDVISLLVFGSRMELAFNIDGNFFIKPTTTSLVGVIRQLNAISSLIFVGKREGSQSGATYTQYFYVCRKGTISNVPNLF